MAKNINILPLETLDTSLVGNTSTNVEIDSEKMVTLLVKPRTGNPAGVVLGFEASPDGSDWYPHYNPISGARVQTPALINGPRSYSFTNIPFIYVRIIVVTAVVSTDVSVCMTGK